ncbi:cytochrome b6-f complex subunit PetL [Parathermosynechococcus lividus]
MGVIVYGVVVVSAIALAAGLFYALRTVKLI